MSQNEDHILSQESLQDVNGGSSNASAPQGDAHNDNTPKPSYRKTGIELTPVESLLFFNIVRFNNDPTAVDWESVATHSNLKNAASAKVNPPPLSPVSHPIMALETHRFDCCQVRYRQIQKKYGLDGLTPGGRAGPLKRKAPGDTALAAAGANDHNDAGGQAGETPAKKAPSRKRASTGKSRVKKGGKKGQDQVEDDLMVPTDEAQADSFSKQGANVKLEPDTATNDLTSTHSKGPIAQQTTSADHKIHVQQGLPIHLAVHNQQFRGMGMGLTQAQAQAHAHAHAKALHQQRQIASAFGNNRTLGASQHPMMQEAPQRMTPEQMAHLRHLQDQQMRQANHRTMNSQLSQQQNNRPYASSYGFSHLQSGGAQFSRQAGAHGGQDHIMQAGVAHAQDQDQTPTWAQGQPVPSRIHMAPRPSPHLQSMDSPHSQHGMASPPIHSVSGYFEPEPENEDTDTFFDVPAAQAEQDDSGQGVGPVKTE